MTERRAAPNIVLVMTDQLRADHVSFLGSSPVETPNIDVLAGSAAFSRCITANPVCTPARTALLTGKYSHQIGMLSMSGDLSRQHPTYMRALQEAGYWTATVGKLHWLQGHPFNPKEYSGFDLVGLRDEIRRYGIDYLWQSAGKQIAANHDRCDYAALLEELGLHSAYQEHVRSRVYSRLADGGLTLEDGEPWPFAEDHYVDNVTGDEVLRCLRTRPADRPFFLFASFCGPHPPFDPPASAYESVGPSDFDDEYVLGDETLSSAERESIRKIRRSYRAMISVIDAQVGRLLDYLDSEGLLEDTVLLFTADHGEMLGDHRLTSKSVPYAASVTVPAAIRHPEHLNGIRCDTSVELTDLTATILDAAGIDASDALSRPWPRYHDRVPCRSLMPVVRGETDRVRDFAFSEHADWQMVEDDRFKYVRYPASSLTDEPRELLFDRADDLSELVDRSADPRYDSELTRLRDCLARVLDWTPPAQLRWAPTRAEPNEEIL